nr:reverse transcriptase domain-containing protein [Tanacetum cinerariifolium]
MTLELVDRSISRPVRVAEDVFVKVGTLYFSADFVVVDFDADPRVPLILERSFLKTGRDFFDVFEGELTLRVGKEAITYNLNQNPRYSANYNDMTTNRIDVIDMACEEYSQEVLGFSDVIKALNLHELLAVVLDAVASAGSLCYMGETAFVEAVGIGLLFSLLAARDFILDAVASAGSLCYMGETAFVEAVGIGLLFSLLAARDF